MAWHSYLSDAGFGAARGEHDRDETLLFDDEGDVGGAEETFHLDDGQNFARTARWSPDVSVFPRTDRSSPRSSSRHIRSLLSRLSQPCLVRKVETISKVPVNPPTPNPSSTLTPSHRNHLTGIPRLCLITPTSTLPAAPHPPPPTLPSSSKSKASSPSCSPLAAPKPASLK